MPELDLDQWQAELEQLKAGRKPTPPAPSTGNATFDRSDAIRREIYQRHGLSPDTPLADAIERITAAGAEHGGEGAAWPSREAREQARVAYAKEMSGLVPRPPEEVRQRYAESIHLLPPAQQEYMQRFGRDLDFLQSASRWASAYPDRRVADATAVRYYDESKDGRLTRAGVYGNPMAPTSGGYQRYGGWLNRLLVDGMTHPETPTGQYVAVSNTVPSVLRTSWGDSPSGSLRHITPPGPYAPLWSLAGALLDGEAWNRVLGANSAKDRTLLATETPILDTATGGPVGGEESASRIAELRQKVLQAAPAEHTERNYRYFGYAPPGVIADPLNNLPDALDPTMAFPALKFATAGKGMAGAVVRDVASDMKWDQATNAGLSGLFGGEPGRSSKQFWLGGGQPGVDFTYRSPEEIAAARQAGRELAADRSKDEGVSAAKREAYKSLEESGALGPLARERARMFPTRQQ